MICDDAERDGGSAPIPLASCNGVMNCGLNVDDVGIYIGAI